MFEQLLATTIQRTERLRERVAPHNVALRRIGLFVAICGFAGGLFWAVNSVSDVWGRLAFTPLVLLFLIGLPTTIALNAAEFRAMLRAAGSHVSWGMALEITVYTSAANMLPIPGGVITRLGGMRARGVSMRQGSWLILLFAGIWGGAALSISGAAIALRNLTLAAPFLLAGFLALAISIKGLRAQRASYALIGKIVSIRTALLAVETVRMALAVQALGIFVSPVQAAVFAISSFVGTAVAIVPAGLGVREGVVALLSPVIGLDPAIGFLSSAINQVVVMVGLAVLASALLVFSRRGLRAEFPAKNNDAPLL